MPEMPPLWALLAGLAALIAALVWSFAAPKARGMHRRIEQPCGCSESETSKATCSYHQGLSTAAKCGCFTYSNTGSGRSEHLCLYHLGPPTPSMTSPWKRHA